MLQGCLPSYRNGQLLGTLGVVLLVLCRVLQGISVGGEIAAVYTFITEVAPQRHAA